jgi:hypothetical protein
MTIESLNKRLSRLASPMANIALSLEMARARHQAREDEWLAAGNTGPMPPEPLEPLEPPPPRPRDDTTGRCGARLPRSAPANWI